MSRVVGADAFMGKSQYICRLQQVPMAPTTITCLRVYHISFALTLISTDMRLFIFFISNIFQCQSQISSLSKEIKESGENCVL